MRSRNDWYMLIQTDKLIKWISTGTLRAIETRTDGRHAVNDKFIEMDYELSVTLISVKEEVIRSTVLNVTQVMSSHGFVTC